MRWTLCLCAVVTFCLAGSPGCDRDSSSSSTGQSGTTSPSGAATGPTTRGAAAADEVDGGSPGMTAVLAKRRAAEQAVREKVRVPESLANTPEAEQYARAAMKLYEKYGPDQVVTVRVVGADVFDLSVRRQLSSSIGSLGLIYSMPVIFKAAGMEAGEYYFTVAPAPDVQALAESLVKAGTGTNPQVDAEKRLIVLTAPAKDAAN